MAGIIGEHASLEDDSRLVRDIAGELHSISRHLPRGALHRSRGENLLRPIPPFGMVQWERHLQEEEQEAREAAEALVDVHQRREQGVLHSPAPAPVATEDDVYWQNTTSIFWGETGPENQVKKTMVMTTPIRAGTGEAAEEGEEESSPSIDDPAEGQDGGRILPVPALTGETNSLHLENRRSEIMPAPSNMQTPLCGRPPHRSDEARRSYQPQGVANDVEYQPASLSEATTRAHRLVGEIIEHCDEISRRAAAGGGEAAERQQRLRRTCGAGPPWGEGKLQGEESQNDQNIAVLEGENILTRLPQASTRDGGG